MTCEIKSESAEQNNSKVVSGQKFVLNTFYDLLQNNKKIIMNEKFNYKTTFTNFNSFVFKQLSKFCDLFFKLTDKFCISIFVNDCFTNNLLSSISIPKIECKYVKVFEEFFKISYLNVLKVSS